MFSSPSVITFKYYVLGVFRILHDNHCAVSGASSNSTKYILLTDIQSMPPK